MAQLIKIYSYTSGIAETKTLPGGRFFRLLKASAPVDVEFFAESGDSLGQAEQILAGLALSIEPSDIGKQSRLIGFARVKITSATAQDIQAAISRQRVEYDRSSGSVDSTTVKQLLPWEGRNPTVINKSYIPGAIAPAARTSRWTYTVPANRIFVASGGVLSMERVTVAAPVGLCKFFIGTTSGATNLPAGFSLNTYSNVIEMGPTIVIPAGYAALAGEVLGLFTHDTSTGGTMKFEAALFGIEFDA